MRVGTLREGRRVSHLLLWFSGLRVRQQVTTNAMMILRGYAPELLPAAFGAARTVGGGLRFLGREARSWSPRVSTFLEPPLRAP